MFVLSKTQLGNIKKWKYSVIDESITSEFLNPIWDTMLNYIPTYVSPNLLTLIGLFCSLFIWLLVEIFYTPILIPFIIMVYCIISTIDALDGKQARKINNSTPMGELFDHSVDTVSLFIITRITCIVIGIDKVNLVPIYIYIGIVFCHTHYQACIDGYIKLSRYGGPNEMLLLIILVYLSSFFIEWRIFFASNLIYCICFMLPFSLIMYYYFFPHTLQFVVQHKSLENIPKIISILACINLFNIVHSVPYLTIVSIFVMVNAELIIAKISKSDFREVVVYLSILCFLNHSIAFYTMTIFMIVTFIQIKVHLGIPFLTTF